MNLSLLLFHSVVIVISVVVLLVTIRKKLLKRRLEIAQRNNTFQLNSYQECAKDIEVSKDDFKKQFDNTSYFESIYDPIYESIDDLSSQKNERDDEISEEPKNCEDSEYVSMKSFPINI